MSGQERPWARHYLDEWQRKSGDPRLPLWLRVSALAYGSHGDNGHANFRRGEVALILGEPGNPYNRVARVIEDAIEYGWLAEGSWWGCLIVPRQAIKRGAHTSPKPCRRCARRGANPPLSGGLGGRSSPLNGGFGDETRHSVAGSEREPLYLISGQQPTNNESRARQEPAS